MKRLSILRHAKSSWDKPDLKDIDRPILPKGIKRTKRICKYLRDNSLIPDCIITSPALRALETANIVIEELNLSLIPQIDEDFYPGRIEEIVDKVSELNSELKHVLLVGHNPCFTDLASELANNFEIDWLSTSGLVVIDYDIRGWEFIVGEKGNCLHYIKPKDLK